MSMVAILNHSFLLIKQTYSYQSGPYLNIVSTFKKVKNKLVHGGHFPFLKVFLLMTNYRNFYFFQKQMIDKSKYHCQWLM